VSGTSGREASALAEVFERLFKSYRSEIFRAVLRSSRNREDAEDLTQTTFLNAYTALLRGAEPEAPRAWLHAIARNAGSRRFRQARLVEVELDPETSPALEEDLTAIHELQSALARLTFNQRASLLMREVGGLSAREIGARLDISPGAVATLLFRARRALRAELDAVDKPSSTSRLRLGVLYATCVRPLWTRLAGPIFDGSEALTRSAAAVGVVAAAAGVAVFTGSTSSPSARADHARAAVAARPVVVVRKPSSPPVARRVQPAPVPLLPHIRLTVHTTAAHHAARIARPVAAAPVRHSSPQANAAELAAAPAPAEPAVAPAPEERAPGPTAAPSEPAAPQDAPSPSAAEPAAAPGQATAPQPVQAVTAPVAGDVSRAVPSTAPVTSAATTAVPDVSQVTSAVPADGTSAPSAPPVSTDVVPAPVAPPPLPAPPTVSLPTG
jgi:RNA polymerase sigma factor (sigma-70 family)